jgi:hypothetical protein
MNCSICVQTAATGLVSSPTIFDLETAVPTHPPTHPPSLELRRALDDILGNSSDAQCDHFSAVESGIAPAFHGTTPAAFPALDFDELRHLTDAMGDAGRYLNAIVLGVPAIIEQQARQAKPDARRGLLAISARPAEFAGWFYRWAHRADPCQPVT